MLGEGWGTGVGFRAGRGREVLGEGWGTGVICIEKNNRPNDRSM